MKKEYFPKKNAFIFLKGILYKSWLAENMPVIAGCLVKISFNMLSKSNCSLTFHCHCSCRHRLHEKRLFRLALCDPLEVYLITISAHELHVFSRII